MNETMISSTVYSTDQSSSDLSAFQIDIANIPDEDKKRKLFTFSCIGIVTNLFLLLYIGPAPWSQQMKYEEDELTIFYYIFDILSILICTQSLISGLSRKNISDSKEVRNFKHKILVFLVVYILNWMILLFKVHIKYEEWLGLIIRSAAIIMIGFVWYQARQLATALSTFWKV